MSRLTRSETAVLDALSDELAAIVPDMPGQITEALAGTRRNTGAGFATEIIVDRSRPSPEGGPTGVLGSVHGDVPGLVEPMAFRAVFSNGRLMALEGSTYGETTDHIDFAAAPVSNLFHIDADGQSVAWEPAVRTVDSPLQRLQEYASPEPRAEAPESRLVNVGAVQRVQLADPGARAMDLIFGKKVDDAPDAADAISDEDLTSTRIGVVVLLAVVCLIGAFVFDVPLPLLAFVPFFGAHLLKSRKALIAAKGLFDQIAARIAESGRAR